MLVQRPERRGNRIPAIHAQKRAVHADGLCRGLVNQIPGVAGGGGGGGLFPLRCRRRARLTIPQTTITAPSPASATPLFVPIRTRFPDSPPTMNTIPIIIFIIIFSFGVQGQITKAA